MKFLDMRYTIEFANLTSHIGIDNLLNYNYAPMESNLLPMRTFTIGISGQL